MTETNTDNIVNECYEKYYQSLYKYCLIRLGDLSEHADDCVQEAFLVFQKRLNDGEVIEQPRPFLYKTVGNFIARTIKRFQDEKKRIVAIDNAENVASPPVIPDEFDYDKCARLIISMLSEDERELYNMKYIEQKSLNEISDILNISPSAAAMRTSRLRRQIKTIIEDLNIFGDEVAP